MDKKLISTILGVAVAGIAVFYLLKEEAPKPATSVYVEEAKRRSGACPGSQSSVSSEGVTYTLIANWYECNLVKKGDLVWYRFAFSKPPVARRVVAAEGDEFSLEKDKSERGWKLLVNKKLVMNAKKEPFLFGSIVHEPPLMLYTKDGRGELAKRQAIVFADSGAGNLDSGLFGIVNADDFLGKVESVSGTQKTEAPHP